MHTIDAQGARQQLLLMRQAERFFDSVVLFALSDLGIFALLANGPKSVEEIHAATGGDAGLLEATLQAAVALDILTFTSHRYAAPPHLVDCLGRPDSPGSLVEWVAFLQACVAPLATLAHGIRSGQHPAWLLEEADVPESAAARMTAAMDAYSRTRAGELPARIDFRHTRTLLDVGCGPGTYAYAILEAYPHVRATLLDYAEPLAQARRIADERCLADRVEFITGDASSYDDGLPFDAVLVSNLLHMIGQDAARGLLARLFSMMTPGGRIIVQAQFLNEDHQSPRWPVLLNLLQRAGTPNGRNHSIIETTQWLTEAGFTGVEHVSLSAWNVCSCLVGTKPA